MLNVVGFHDLLQRKSTSNPLLLLKYIHEQFEYIYRPFGGLAVAFDSGFLIKGLFDVFHHVAAGHAEGTGLPSCG